MTTGLAKIKFDDVAALEAAIASGAMTPTQLSLRPPTGQILAVHFGPSIVTYAKMDADYAVSGVMSEDQIAFGWVVESDQSQLLGCDAIAGDFAVYPAGAEHNAWHRSKLAYLVVTVDFDRLIQVAESEGIELDRSALTKAAVYRPCAQWAAFSTDFAKQIVTSLEMMAQTSTSGSHSLDRARKILVDDLVRLFLHSLVQTDLAEVETRPTYLKGQKIVREAQQLLINSEYTPPCLDDLLELAAVSERTLYRVFQCYMGMSPARYLKLFRMIRAHIELLRAGNSNARVGPIAEKWGFGHHGRFANEYRKMFGMSPSETLSHYAFPARANCYHMS